MSKINVEEEIRYALAAGTDDERHVPWKPGRHLREAVDQIFPRLATIHQGASQKTLNNPLETQQGVFVEAIFTLWCYTAHDISALRDRCAALEAKNKELEEANVRRDRLVEELAHSVEAIATEAARSLPASPAPHETWDDDVKRIVGGEGPPEAEAQDEEMRALHTGADVMAALGRESLAVCRTALDRMDSPMSDTDIAEELEVRIVWMARMARRFREIAQEDAVACGSASVDDGDIPF